MESKQQEENIFYLILNHDKIDTLKIFFVFFYFAEIAKFKKKQDFYYFIFSFYKYI